MKWVARVVHCLAWSGLIPLVAAPLPRPYTIENYDVSIHADLVKQRLIGEVKIRIRGRGDTAVSALELDGGELQIASVLEGQAPQWFERRGSILAVVLTNPLHIDEQRTLTVRYQAGPAAGLKFFADQIYTSVTSDWMPCNDRSDERATLHLAISAPLDFKVAASGHLTATRASEGQTITEWQLDRAAAPSLFGFALGAFAEHSSEADGVKLRVLGADVLEPTAAAIRYIAERSGKHYPGQSYTQVFVHGDTVCAIAGLTLLPESYAQGLAKQPDNLWLLANELAHQWYGVQIASKDWSDLWLSDGISAFLADKFLGQRFGQASYERELDHSRQIYSQLRTQGKDRSLSYTGWATLPEAAGEIPVHKGAWFLSEVYQLTGDSTFWEALRLYTSHYWDQAVIGEDLQTTFEAVGRGDPAASQKKGESARNANTVDKLFARWVFGIPDQLPKKKRLM
jgi:aminopeptidase N